METLVDYCGIRHLFGMLLSLFFVFSAQAADVRYLTYAGRIVDDAGNAVSTSVQFNIKITDSTGTCVFWEETLTDTLTNGIFSLQIGRGTNVFDGFGTASLEGIFQQGLAINCKDGTPSSSKTPLVTDDRNMIVSFNDGTGWQTVASQIPIRSVPYALYSENVAKLVGYSIAVTAAPTNGQVLQFQSGSNTWVPTTLSAGGPVAAGSAAAPGYAFSGNTNTGMFGAAANQIGLATNGVERVRIDAIGNVGIGTTSPGYPLDVQSSNTSTSGSASSANFTLSTNPSGASTETGLGLVSYANKLGSNATSGDLTSVMGFATNFGTGNMNSSLVGISGLASDAGSGTVQTAIGLQGLVSTSSGNIASAYGASLSVAKSGSGTITNGYGVYTGAIAGTNKWSFYASDATAPAYFAGNVGIGVPSPSAPLDVRGVYSAGNFYVTTGPTIATFGGNGGFSGIGNYPVVNISNGNGTTGSGASLNFMHSNTHPLTVSGSQIVSQLSGNSDPNLATDLEFFTSSVASGVTEKLRILSTGNVGIGTTSPTANLQVDSTTGDSVIYVARRPMVLRLSWILILVTAQIDGTSRHLVVGQTRSLFVTLGARSMS